MSIPKWQEDVANGRAWATQNHHMKIRAHFRFVLPKVRELVQEIIDMQTETYEYSTFEAQLAQKALALLDQEDASSNG